MTTPSHRVVSGRSAMLALGLFVTNFLWEMAQARFYSSMKGLPTWSATWLCTRAAAADVAWLTLFFVMAALVARDVAWPLHPALKAPAAFFSLCLFSAAVIEHWAIAAKRWRYSSDMPMIFGVGSLPLLQWIVIPALFLYVFRVAFRPKMAGRR